MSVVLPIPLGPTMAMRAPLETVKDTPLKISVGPYDFASELTVMSDMIFQFLDLNAPYYTQRGHKLRSFKSGKPQFMTMGII